MNQQQQALMSDINQQTTISQQLTAQIQSQALQ